MNTSTAISFSSESADGKKVEQEFTTYSKLLVHKRVLVGCTSNYSVLLELLPQLPMTIGQANLKLLIRIFRRNTV